MCSYDLQVFEKINFSQGKKFLDIGSGDGRVVLLAAMHGARATGVEIDERFKAPTERSQNKVINDRLIGFGEVNWIYQDVMDIDISDYDIIFLYDGGLSVPKEKLEEKIIREAKDSVLVVIQHERHPQFEHLKPLRKISNLFKRDFSAGFTLYVKNAKKLKPQSVDLSREFLIKAQEFGDTSNFENDPTSSNRPLTREEQDYLNRILNKYRSQIINTKIADHFIFKEEITSALAVLARTLDNGEFLQLSRILEASRLILAPPVLET